MRNSWHFPFFLIFSIYVSGCAIQFKLLDTSATITDLEAVVVLGVSPRLRLSISEGEMADGIWTCKNPINIANVWPEEGFIILKLKPRTATDNYAITQILPDGIGGQSFTISKGTAVPVFNAQPGKVTFVGAVKIMKVGTRYAIGTDPSVTLENASTFIAKRYPLLPKEIKSHELEIITVASGC